MRSLVRVYVYRAFLPSSWLHEVAGRDSALWEMPLSFDSNHYAGVIREYGYDPVGFSSVPMMPALTHEADEQVLRCCSYNVGDVLQPDQQILFSTGIGMSGCPHMGTVSQIVRARMLQKAGYRMQLVLGDIDAYTGRNITWSKMQELAERYSRFITSLGFSADGLCPRRQSTSEHMLTCLSLVARRMSFELASGSEEDLHDDYARRRVVAQQMTFSRIYSLSLMCADFIAPLLSGDASKVIVFLGIDEHRYVLAARNILKAMGEEFERCVQCDISALYSPLIKGFSGFPKMSKSFPESSIALTDSASDIRDKVLGDRHLERDPKDNAVYQLICALRGSTRERVERLRAAYESGRGV